MKITSIQIDGFGVFSGAALPAVSPGLTVICAANGGGKTTLRDFLRASLFGFARNANRYEPISGVHGGSIEFVARDGAAYRLIFNAVRKKQQLLCSDGTAGPELELLLGSASLDLYRHVFAIGLGELQDASTLNGEQIHAMIGGFGSGQSGRAFQQARSGVAKDAEEIFKLRGQTPKFNAALSAQEKLRDELKQHRQEAEEYWSHEARLHELHREIENCRDQERQARQRCQHFQNLEKAWPDWIAVQNLRQELEQLRPRVEKFPHDGTTRLHELQAQLDGTERDLKRVQQTQADSTRVLEELVVCEKLLQTGSQLDELSDGFQLHAKNLDARIKQQDERDRLVASLKEELARLGRDDADESFTFDDSVASMAEKAEAARELSEAERAVERSGENLSRHQRRQQEFEEEAAAARADFESKWPSEPITHNEIDARLNQLSALRATLNNLQHLRTQQTQCSREADEALQRVLRIQERIQATTAQTPAPSIAPAQKMRAASWGALAAGALLAALSYSNYLVMAVALLLGVGGWLLIRHLGKGAPAVTNSAPEYLKQELEEWEIESREAQQRADDAAATFAAAEAELERLARAFAGKSLTLENCDELQAKLMLLREKRRGWEVDAQQLRAVEAKVLEAEKTQKNLQAEWEFAQEPLARARQRWCAWLKLRGLDEGLSAEAAEAVCRQVLRIREAKKNCAGVEAELQQLTRQIDLYNQKLAEYFEAIGRPLPEANDINRSLKNLRAECSESESNLQRRKELLLAIPAREREIEELEKQHAELQGQREQLLQEAKSTDEAEFALRANAWAKRQQLQAEERTCIARLEMLSAPGEAVQRLQHELTELEHSVLADNSAQARQALETLVEMLNRLNQELGQIEEARRKLAGEDKVAETQQRFEAGQAALQDLAEEWAVRKLAFWLMEKARAKIEVERQPAVLLSAGRCLNTISGGRFTGIVQPLGSDEYQIVQHDGIKRDNAQTWNTALREKTYLSLRFGLIDSYCAQAEPLPLILDDALVNLDPQNCAGAVRCIHEMAQRHQIFYLTCHPHALHHFSKLDTPQDFWEIRDGAFYQSALPETAG